MLFNPSFLNNGNNTLNTFNSTFSASELTYEIQKLNDSIVANELSLQLQKKIYPNLTTPTTYNLRFGVPLEKGMFQSGIISSPAMQYRNTDNLSNIVDGIYIEEVPSSTNAVESVSVINPGFGYTAVPTVTIYGDGTGATAHAVLSGSGSIAKIIVDNGGNGYTSAAVTITPAQGDSTGQLATAVANLSGRYGTLRSYFNNTKQVKTV